jgi:sec-independent protein translocase protein TatA
MGLSTTHLLMLVAVVVLLFGRNKISDLMGDVAKGIKSFKKGIADDPQVEIAHDPSSVGAPRESTSPNRP